MTYLGEADRYSVIEDRRRRQSLNDSYGVDPHVTVAYQRECDP